MIQTILALVLFAVPISVNWARSEGQNWPKWKVHYGPTESTMTQVRDVGTATTAAFDVPPDVQQCYAVQGYDDVKNESSPVGYPFCHTQKKTQLKPIISSVSAN